MNQTIVQFYPDATKSLIAPANALLISAAARTETFLLGLIGRRDSSLTFSKYGKINIMIPNGGKTYISFG